MDTKGETEDMSYPYICFMVDNFDEVIKCFFFVLRNYLMALFFFPFQFLKLSVLNISQESFILFFVVCQQVSLVLLEINFL